MIQANGLGAEDWAGTIVLVVDDEPLVRQLTADMLADAGFVVLEAGGGAEALGLLQTAAGIELIVSDINMPAQDGLSFAAAAWEKRPRIPVLFVSGNARPSGARRFLAKPFSYATLLNAVTTALADARLP